MSKGEEQQREAAAAPARRCIDEERPTTAAAAVAAHCRGAGPVAVPQRRGRRFEEEPPTTTAAAAAAHCRCGSAVSVPPRRGRWFDEEPTTTRTATAGRAGSWRCRSCAAVAIADCVALGCCPCAVVSLLGLALVKAPLAVGRRCVGRLRRRRRFVLHKKRVRDAAANAAACDRDKGAKAETPPPDAGRTPAAAAADDAPASAATVAASAPPAPAGQAEAWLDEMYRVGHWGFGRVSFSESGNTP